MRKFNSRAFLLLSCGHVAVDTFQGALPAVLPFLKDRLSLSYTMAGIILIVANISSSVIQPVFGRLADRKNTFWGTGGLEPFTKVVCKNPGLF